MKDAAKNIVILGAATVLMAAFWGTITVWVVCQIVEKAGGTP